jgi:lauroyl/myristoyl acyltransferase
MAGAGTGKTNTLTHRVARLILDGVDPRRLLLLTFTRRAAIEMTRRTQWILATSRGGATIGALRRGTHLAPLADQKMNDGIPAPFFGRPAMTAPVLAVLALRFDCDVLPARVERLGGAHFRLTVFPPLPLP